MENQDQISIENTSITDNNQYYNNTTINESQGTTNIEGQQDTMGSNTNPLGGNMQEETLESPHDKDFGNELSDLTTDSSTFNNIQFPYV